MHFFSAKLLWTEVSILCWTEMATADIFILFLILGEKGTPTFKFHLFLNFYFMLPILSFLLWKEFLNTTFQLTNFSFTWIDLNFIPSNMFYRLYFLYLVFSFGSFKFLFLFHAINTLSFRKCIRLFFLFHLPLLLLYT